ncbi:MAG: hypothetical protein ABIA02_02630 [Candidatus Falkowbacteria bacterium]
MYLMETSKDLLYIAISISVAGLAFFTCWAIFYLAMILRQSFKIVKEMRERINKIDEIIKIIKEKACKKSAHIALVGEGVKKLFEMIKKHSEKDRKKKKTTKKK